MEKKIQLSKGEIVMGFVALCIFGANLEPKRKNRHPRYLEYRFW